MSNRNVGKVRATTHRGRRGRNGVYTPRHNDRDFDVSRSEHIDAASSNKNIYWHWYKKVHPNWTFDDAEKQFYEDHFSKYLKGKNERYKKSRHPERMQSMDAYRKSARSCPEEMIIQLGKHDQVRPSSEILWRIMNEYEKWEHKKFTKPNAKVVSLNVALHRDEPDAADHIHRRQVYMWLNENGEWEVNQEKALEALGIERPNPEKKKGRYNNRKQTYTKICRDKFIEIAKSHGVQIETEPQEPGKVGLDLMEYKLQQTKEQIDQTTKQINHLKGELSEVEGRLTKAENRLRIITNKPDWEKADIIERDVLIKAYYPDIWDWANEKVQTQKMKKGWTAPEKDTVIKENEDRDRSIDEDPDR